MKRETLLAGLALVCLGSSAADEPRRIELLSSAQQAAACRYEGEDFEPGARVCRNGQFWECQPGGQWINLEIRCGRKP